MERFKKALFFFFPNFYHLANLSSLSYFPSLTNLHREQNVLLECFSFVACRIRPWASDVIQSKPKTIRVFPLASGNMRSRFKILKARMMVLYSDLILQVAKDHNIFLRSIEIRLSAYVESSLGVGYIFSCSSRNWCCASEAARASNLRYCHWFLCSWEGKGNRDINLYHWPQESDKHKTVSEFFLLIGKHAFKSLIIPSDISVFIKWDSLEQMH